MARRVAAIAVLIAFGATIPAANWMISNVGTVCPADSPCLIPVGFGLMAPSGVVMIGVALVLRDAVQRLMGVGWAAVAIVIGAALSATFAPAALAIASGAAFLLSESADLAVYTPLQRRRLTLAVLASGVVGAFVDSAIFLWLAFGNLDFLTGQVVGKMWASVLAVPLIWGWRAAVDAAESRRGA